MDLSIADEALRLRFAPTRGSQRAAAPGLRRGQVPGDCNADARQVVDGDVILDPLPDVHVAQIQRAPPQHQARPYDCGSHVDCLIGTERLCCKQQVSVDCAFPVCRHCELRPNQQSVRVL